MCEYVFVCFHTNRFRKTCEHGCMCTCRYVYVSYIRRTCRVGGSSIRQSQNLEVQKSPEGPQRACLDGIGMEELGGCPGNGRSLRAERARGQADLRATAWPSLKLAGALGLCHAERRERW